ncbi:conserved hypothetical protein [Pseudomonas protegens Pf-5]|uniref:Uncharacterized protein n=1 Tax=Pseudomonas fluorescens (strain ATCC BAA-477 / NRRL B-23932 / Pf-5) TaxID=220664 RepID=Q4KB38_PSEF5|nr:conserved hypothetical protein [Pseudomonas protegens Pf-5]
MAGSSKMGNQLLPIAVFIGWGGVSGFIDQRAQLL